MNIAIIGNSGHHAYVTEALQQLDSCQMVAIAAGCPDEELDKRFLRQWKDVPVFENADLMLEECGAELVVVNTHFHLQSHWTIRCLKRNLHVFAEKPVALNLDELCRLKHAASLSSAQLGLMMSYRFHPAFVAAQDAVKKGCIGDVVHFFAQKSYQNFPKPKWQHVRQKYGGTIPWVGSHAIDWITWFCPKHKITRCLAKGCRSHNKGNGELESSAYIVFDFEGDVGQGMISIDYLRPSGAPSHGDDRIRIAGSLGVIEVMNDHAQLIDSDGVHDLKTEQQPSIFAEFIDSITGKNPYRQSLDEVWRMSELCIAAQESADTLKPILRTL